MSGQQLSKNFSLKELTDSQTAARLGIDNTPSFEVIGNLQNLAINVLQPLRDLVKSPIVISSGYRSPALNKAIGGAANSEHMLGRAADLIVPGKPNIDIARLIVNSDIVFNQLILEFYRESDPFFGWVHISYSLAGNKKEVLKFDGNSYTHGLPQ